MSYNLQQQTNASLDPTVGPYFFQGTGTAADTAALNACAADASARGRVLDLPHAPFSIGAAFNMGGGAGGEILMRGMPGQTVINVLSTSATGVHLGNGTVTGSLITGCIDGVQIAGPGKSSNGQAGLLIDAMRQLEIRRVYVGGFDIGVDTINNSCGLTLTNVDTSFFGTCNVGLNLRTTPNAGAGNQTFVNECWLEGAIAAAHLSPNGDGCNFKNGQMVSARGATGNQDAYGAIIAGKDYLTGVTGSMGIVLVDDIDFEQCGAWIFRGYGQLELRMDGSPCLSNGSTNTIGILKIDNAGNPIIDLGINEISGAFSGAVPIIISDYGGADIKEGGWMTTGSGATFAGVTPNTRSLMAFSGIKRGFAVLHEIDGSEQIILGGTRIKATTDGSLATSPITDNVNWTPITEAVVPVHPTAFGTLASWQAADRIIPAPADASALTTWADSSSAGVTVSAVAATAPTFRNARSSVILPNSGLPVVAFSGSQFMTSTLSASTAISGAIVAMATALTASGSNVLFGSSSAGGFQMRVQNGGAQMEMESDYTAGIGDTGTQNLGIALGDYHVYAFSYANPGIWILMLDGIVVGTGTSTVAFATGKTLVIGKGSQGSNWQGAIAEYPLVAAASSVASLARLSAGLMKRYGIF